METTPDTLPESSVPPAHLKSVVVRIKADSSNSTVDTKSHVKEPSKKRRQSSDSEDSDSDPQYTPPLKTPRKRAGRTPKRKRHRKSPDQSNSVGGAKKTGRKRQRSEGRHKRFKGFVIRPRELNLPSRVVNDAEGKLQITILRGQLIMCFVMDREME